MSEENYIKEKRKKKGILYRNKLRRIFKEEVQLLHAMVPELMDPVEYFRVIIGTKVYYISYVPIEEVKFKDKLEKIFNRYWLDIFSKYINSEELMKYKIGKKGE